MPILSSIIDKILSEETNANQPVSQAVVQKIGQNINALIDQFSSVDSFTTAGVHNWVVPDNTTRVLLYGCGGGGGGAGNSPGVGYPRYGGGGGGGAACVWQFVDGLTPGDIIAVTVGSAGPGGAYNANGGAGGNTTFGAFTTFRGASGGKIFSTNSNIGVLDPNNAACLFVAGSSGSGVVLGGVGDGGACGGGTVFNVDSFGNFIPIAAANGQNSARFIGGATYAPISGPFGGGGGGASMFGHGGNGGFVTESFPFPLTAAQSPMATAFGAGGGGGAGSINAAYNAPGAAGIHGALFIFRI